MELKVGMYVRTEKGIIFKYYPCKNTEYDEESNIYHEWDDWGEYDDYYIITKASENIIGLIQIGDYVNGRKVDKIAFVDGKYYIKTKVSNTGNYDYLPEHLIKDIVTKEQFESMKYEVKKDE